MKTFICCSQLDIILHALLKVVALFHLQISMKEQDKALMKQFINLRSGIVQLQCLYKLNGIYSDVSQERSCFSLDELGSSSPHTVHNGYLANLELEMTEFRARTTSLLSPRERKCGPVTKIKWKSNEYI